MYPVGKLPNPLLRVARLLQRLPLGLHPFPIRRRRLLCSFRGPS